ncbi:hypothetical protein FD754_018483, partial [Muntiacus muntjak]
SFPHSCSTLGRKIATLCDSFTSKSLKEHICPPLMHMLIFVNFFKAPFLVDLKKPELKIPHTVNFYIKVEPGVILGIWHTVPSCRGEDAKGKGRSWYEAALCDGNPIIVYLHGSAQHRAASHRLKLVKVLSNGGFHVLSVDYRGFGDSTGTPTEDGLTADAVCVYEWTKARSGTTPVCLWGHSLGTGVATNAAKVLEEKEHFKSIKCPTYELLLTCILIFSISYTPQNIIILMPPGSSVHGFLHALLQGIFPTLDMNLHLLSVRFLEGICSPNLQINHIILKCLYSLSSTHYRN